MKTHTTIGSRLLRGGHSALMRMAETIARSHHERWDGTGYPDGLRGEEIPLLGRIVAVADVFDALTSERPYKKAWTPEEALAEIVAQAGRQFDPRVVEALVRLPNASGPLPPREGVSLPAASGHDLPELDALLQEAWAGRYADPERCRELSLHARAEAERRGDVLRVGYALRNLAWVSLAYTDLEACVPVLSRAVHLARDLGDLHLERDCANLIARVYSLSMSAEEAVRYCLRALELSRALGDTRGEGSALNNLGVLLMQMGDPQASRGYLRQALDLARRLEDLPTEADVLSNLVGACADLGQYEEAEAHARHLYDLAVHGPGGRSLTIALLQLGRVADLRGDHAQAGRWFDEAFLTLEGVTFEVFQIEGWLSLYAAHNRDHRGLTEASRDLTQTALSTARAHHVVDLELEALQHLYALERRSGNLVEAATALKRERQIRRQQLQTSNLLRARAVVFGHEMQRLVTAEPA